MSLLTKAVSILLLLANWTYDKGLVYWVITFPLITYLLHENCRILLLIQLYALHSLYHVEGQFIVLYGF